MKNLKLVGHVLSLVIIIAPNVSAQSPALGDGPWEFETVNPSTRIRVSVITKGLTRPWGLAFLPNGDILVTEMAGSLRIIRNGVLDSDEGAIAQLGERWLCKPAGQIPVFAILQSE